MAESTEAAVSSPDPRGTGPLMIVRRGLRLLPPSFRRKIIVSIVGAVSLAVLESGALGVLFVLIRLISDEGASAPSLLTALLGGADRGSIIARTGGLALVLLLLRSAGSLLLIRRQAALQAEADAFLATRLFEAYLASPYETLLQRNSAQTQVTIAYRVPDVAANSVGAVVSLAADAAVLLGVTVTLVAVEPRLAAGIIVYFALVAFGLLRLLTPAIRGTAFRESREADGAQQLLQEGIGGYKAIKANELTGFFGSRFRARREALRLVRQQRILLNRLPAFYLETSLYIGLALLAVIVFRLGEGQVVSTFGILVAATLRTLPSVNRVVGSLAGIRASEAALTMVEADLQAVLGAPLAKSAPARSVLPLRDSLVLRDVRFQYPRAETDALSAIFLRVPAGEALGLVGGSGAGKTTLVDIVLGLLRPTSGTMSVDGHEVTDAELPAWRQTIGYVPQEVFLLDATLRDNILFGRSATPEALASAVALSQLREVVERLPDGLETRVGERGTRLSGGQRQRIGIARALLTQPTLLILDEATSALDNRTEAAVTKALVELRGVTTTIVIAHRLSTVKSCDRVVLLEQGGIAGEGTFEELRRSSPLFAELVRLGDLGDH